MSITTSSLTWSTIFGVMIPVKLLVLLLKLLIISITCTSTTLSILEKNTRLETRRFFSKFSFAITLKSSSTCEWWESYDDRKHENRAYDWNVLHGFRGVRRCWRFAHNWKASMSLTLYRSAGLCGYGVSGASSLPSVYALFALSYITDEKLYRTESIYEDIIATSLTITISVSKMDVSYRPVDKGRKAFKEKEAR